MSPGILNFFGQREKSALSESATSADIGNPVHRCAAPLDRVAALFFVGASLIPLCPASA